jgi:uncharacterized protein with PIN domain
LASHAEKRRRRRRKKKGGTIKRGKGASFASAKRNFRFLVDGMLGSLAIKLRILGFDTEYDKTSPDSVLVETALKTGRLLLTSDVSLFLRARLKHAESVLISSRSGGEEERLAKLFVRLGIPRINVSENSPSRCSQCNGMLAKTGERTELGKSIYMCDRCGKKYWRGSHWKKLDSLFAEVNIRIGKEGHRQSPFTALELQRGRSGRTTDKDRPNERKGNGQVGTHDRTQLAGGEG